MDKVSAYIEDDKIEYPSCRYELNSGMALKAYADSYKNIRIIFYKSIGNKELISVYEGKKLHIEIRYIKEMRAIENMLNKVYTSSEYSEDTKETLKEEYKERIDIEVIDKKDDECNIEIDAFNDYKKLYVRVMPRFNKGKIEEIKVVRKGVKDGRLVIEAGAREITNVKVEYKNSNLEASDEIKILSSGDIKSIEVNGDSKVIMREMSILPKKHIECIDVHGMIFEEVMGIIGYGSLIDILKIDENKMDVKYGKVELMDMQYYIESEQIRLICCDDDEAVRNIVNTCKNVACSLITVENYEDGYRAFKRARMLGIDAVVVVNKK